VSFVTEKTVRAVRKARACEACGTVVNAGETAISWAGVVEGEFSASLFHPECRAAEIALNHLHDVRWGDDWMGLRFDMEPEDHPWLLADHPIVAARMGITAETIAEEAA
jgi:hypothetical protein